MSPASSRPNTDRRPQGRHRLPRRRLAAVVLALLVALVACSGLLTMAPPAGAASAGSVSGVVRTESGAPVKNASVSIAGLTTITGLNGAYSISNVPFGGNLFILASAPCRGGGGDVVTVDGAETRDLTLLDQFAIDNFGHVCRPFGTNFGLDPAVTNLQALVGDDESQQVTLPFGFPFYDNFKSSLTISTNGYVTFGAANSLFANTDLAAPQAPADSIFAFWDDLVVDQFSAIMTGVRNSTPGERIFKIRWQNVRFVNDNSGARLSIELSLREDGTINVIWVGVDASNREKGDSATIGIKGPGAGDSLDLLGQSLNTPTLVNALGVEYVENAAPIARAGADRTVPSGKAFGLDGSGSVDPDGPGVLTFQWTQIAGPATVIQDPKKAKATVNPTTGPKKLTYRVAVRDQFGRLAFDDVTITVSAPAPK